MKTFCSFLLISLVCCVSSCKQEAPNEIESASPCDLPAGTPLGNILPGKWQIDAHKGYPDSDTLWHTYSPQPDDDFWVMHFGASGTFLYGDIDGTWSADNENNFIILDYDADGSIDLKMRISDFDLCTFVVKYQTDEGPVFNRFKKI